MRYLAALAGALALAIVVIVGAPSQESAAQTTSEENSTDEVVLTLEKAVPVEKAIDTAESEDAQPTELVANYSPDNNEYTAGYSVDESASSISNQEVSDAMIDMFEKDAAQLEQSSLPEDKRAAGELSSLIGSLEVDGAEIKTVEVSTNTSIDDLESNPNIENATEPSAGIKEQEQVSPEESSSEESSLEEISFQNVAQSSKRWSPRFGDFETTCCVNGKRFVYHSVIWDPKKLRALKTVGVNPNNITFELESLYTKAGNTYLGRKRLSRGPGWTSNLPRAYLDTELSDPGPVRNIAVGTADARQLRSEKTYYGRVTTDKRYSSLGAFLDANSDRGGVRYQIGRRRPAICYQPACIFQQPTAAEDLKIPPNPGYRVPGGGIWFIDEYGYKEFYSK